MKIIDLYESEFLTDKDEIINWMNESFMGFDPYQLTIETDGLVYRGGGLVVRRNITKLKVQFKEVTGHFSCSESNLTDLIGCPQIIGESFYCSNTKITSLIGGPKTVNDEYFCNNNNITSLKGCPQSIGKLFSCKGTKITDSKEYRYALYSEIGGTFYSDIDQINEIINTYKGSANRKHWAMAINMLSKIEF